MQRVEWLVLAILLLPGTAAAQHRGNGPKHKPEPAPVCAELTEDKRRATEACKTDEEKREDDAKRRQKEAEEKEKPVHTSFLRWVHLDSMWMPTSVGPTTIGMIGMHVAVANVGRVYFFGPPGVMLLLEDYGNGRRVRPAFTWGVSVHLTQFRVPGSAHEAQLFLNLAKCWTTGDERTGLDMGGLSITWKK